MCISLGEAWFLIKKLLLTRLLTPHSQFLWKEETLCGTLGFLRRLQRDFYNEKCIIINIHEGFLFMAL